MYGFDGSELLFTGWPNGTFNMFSQKSYQINALLKKFPHVDEVKTWIGELGIQIGVSDKIFITGAGKGKITVSVNGKAVQELGPKVNLLSSGSYVRYKKREEGEGEEVVIKTPDMMIQVELIRWSFMFSIPQVSLNLGDVHGVLGQSYVDMVAKVPTKLQSLEGADGDYYVADGIWGNEFKFNKFQHVPLPVPL